MPCTIHYQGVRQRFSAPWIHRIVGAALHAGRRTGRGHVAVVFADNRTVRTLNRVYRKRDTVTDVLSFPSDGEEIGDVIIAVPHLRRVARAEHKTFALALVERIAHGVLHALGYDHIRKRDATRMFTLQERIVRRISAHR